MKLTKKAGGWLETEPEVLVRVGGGFGLGFSASLSPARRDVRDSS